MGWLTQWRNTRAVRRFDRVHDRELRVFDLEERGRWAEAAHELGLIAQEYARQTRVVDYHTAVIGARIRRCEALIHAGDTARARSEAAQLATLLDELEGPDGPTRRALGERLAIASQETEDG